MRPLTIKQARFASAYLECGNASQAYREAYDCAGMKAGTINDRACELLRHGGIAAVIAEHQSKLMSAAVVSVDGLTKELLDTAKEARAGDGWSAAASCYKTVAGLHGLLVKRLDVTSGGNDFRIVRRLPEDAPAVTHPDAPAPLERALDSSLSPPVAARETVAYQPRAPANPNDPRVVHPAGFGGETRQSLADWESDL